MRKFILSVLLIISATLQSLGQRTFSLSVEQEVRGDLLLLRFFVQKNSGEDFALGTSNIAVNLNNEALDVAKKFKIDSMASPFDGKTDPNSYHPLTLGGDKIVNLTIVVNSSGKGVGQRITSQKILVAGVGVPIIDKCGLANVTWIRDKVALCIYSKKAKPTNIVDRATFVDPGQIALRGPLPVPSISENLNRSLFVNFEGKKQWFLNNDSIPGATASVMVPNISGRYTVRIYDGCGQFSTSKIYHLNITSSDRQVLDLALIEAFPNPFTDNIHFRFKNSSQVNIHVNVFDAVGNLLLQKEFLSGSDLNFEGEISSLEYRLPAGYYFAEIIFGDSKRTLKLLKLNS